MVIVRAASLVSHGDLQLLLAEDLLVLLYFGILVFVISKTTAVLSLFFEIYASIWRAILPARGGPPGCIIQGNPGWWGIGSCSRSFLLLLVSFLYATVVLPLGHKPWIIPICNCCNETSFDYLEVLVSTQSWWSLLLGQVHRPSYTGQFGSLETWLQVTWFMHK